MKAKDIIQMGFPEGPLVNTARAAAGSARLAGRSNDQVKGILRALLRDPRQFAADPIFGNLARAAIEAGLAPEHPPEPPRSSERAEPLNYAVWGSDIDPAAHDQMRNACRLPVSVAGALMPDAHVGYGLPIGGVLATDNAVIPYAVGVDIACRMMMTVFDLPPEVLKGEEGKYRNILEANTRFGVGSEWKPRREHPVMDEDWRVTPITAELKDQAHRQLGTSGSGNHFVEFGELELHEPYPCGTGFQPVQHGLEGHATVPPGRYLAVLSHSGSRGAGARIADHYSKWARSRHQDLDRELQHLAWLDLNSVGAEYWAAMELMGKYASANHHVIHRQIARAVGDPLFQLENHHNFAWKERHNGRDVIVHRKGATPAGRGVHGIIPGSMASPGFIVEGLGNPASLDSASHGAGRCMSRKKAMETFTWSQAKKYLQEKGVTLISAGLDEVPFVYKNIEEVMAAQKDLVRPIARFMPRLVKMAPAGERPED
jgi:tRNA-splicing ligase RtcB